MGRGTAWSAEQQAILEKAAADNVFPREVLESFQLDLCFDKAEILTQSLPKYSLHHPKLSRHLNRPRNVFLRQVETPLSGQTVVIQIDPETVFSSFK